MRRYYTPTYAVNWYHDCQNEDDDDGYNLTALCDACAQAGGDIDWASADDGTTSHCHCCGREQEVIR
jgi:hypothetical protein